MLQIYNICKLHFVFDVNPYFYQMMESANDHKEETDFRVVLFH